MKLWSKEALLLGGFYEALSAPWLYWQNDVSEKISMVLLGLFILSMVLLCFNKPLFFLNYASKHWPGISYYLRSIGWLAYFTIIGMVIIPLAAGLGEWQEGVMRYAAALFNAICAWGVPASLLAAFIWAQTHKAKGVSKSGNK